METAEIRSRLTALEERARDAAGLSLAIKATLSAMPEIANADRRRALESLESLAKSLPDGPAVKVRAARHLEDLLAAAPESCRL